MNCLLLGQGRLPVFGAYRGDSGGAGISWRLHPENTWMGRFGLFRYASFPMIPDAGDDADGLLQPREALLKYASKDDDDLRWTKGKRRFLWLSPSDIGVADAACNAHSMEGVGECVRGGERRGEGGGHVGTRGPGTHGPCD